MQVESFEYCYIIIEVTNDEGGKVYKVLESVLNEIGLRTGDYKMKFTGSFHKCCEWLNTRKGIKYMIDYKDSLLNTVYDEDEYTRFVEFGRIRKIAKSIDARSLTVERNNHVIVQLSTGQWVDCTKYFGMKDDVVRNWLTVLCLIGKGV